jgi:4-amino-4-deoxy-L-arabinose transferase-like glycosyltransferase
MDKATRLHRWELWTLVVILLVAAVLRLVALNAVPPGLRYDELLNYRMAQRVLAGERPLYFAESWGEEPVFLYAQAAAMALTKECDWSLRLPAALFGLLGVLTAWLAARRLLGARAAILATAALAVSFWSIFYSRQGLRVLAVTPLHGLMVYFLQRGLRRPSARRRRAMLDFLLGGVCMGIPFYIYPAARLVPLLLVALSLYLALFHRLVFSRVWLGLLVAGIVAAGLAAPVLGIIYGHPGMEQRIGQLTAAWTALKGGDPRPISSLAIHTLGMFVWRGERDWLYNVYGRPIFDPLTGICFALGVVLCVRQWRRTRYALLLLWLGVGIAPAMIVPPPASLSHTIAAQPPAYMLVAVGLEALWRAARRRWQWAGPLLAAGTVALHGALSCHEYFITWANAPEVRGLHQGGIATVAHELDTHDPPGPVAVGAPYVSHWHPWNAVAFDLALRRDDLSVRWFNPAGGWVWPAGAGPATFYFPTAPLGPQTFDPVLEGLFLADATMLPPASDDFAAFRVTHPAALDQRLDAIVGPPMAWPLELAHLPPPTLPLVFGDRFALLGDELRQDTVSAGDELRLITYWEVLSADPTPVVAFVHLTAGGQDIWGQHDWLDVRPAGLQPGDRFAQVHPVLVQPETPPGLYVLQLGLYDPDTLQRLSIATGAEDAADRVWVGEVQVK